MKWMNLANSNSMEWMNSLANGNAASQIEREAEKLGVLPLPVEIVSSNGTSSALHPGSIGGSVAYNHEVRVKLNSGYVITIKDGGLTSSGMLCEKSIFQQIEDLIKSGMVRLVENDKQIKASRDEFEEMARRSKMTPEEVFIEKHSKWINKMEESNWQRQARIYVRKYKYKRKTIWELLMFLLIKNY